MAKETIREVYRRAEQLDIQISEVRELLDLLHDVDPDHRGLPAALSSIHRLMRCAEHDADALVAGLEDLANDADRAEEQAA